VKRTLEVLNELENQSVFSSYAIGGAMAATFYTEPVLTFDLDVFVVLSPGTGQLISLAPVYEALRARGYGEEKETVVIEGVPVQFLPAYNALVEEALGRWSACARTTGGTSDCHWPADRTLERSRSCGDAARTSKPRPEPSCRYPEAAPA
jgi:hypothetical protein